MQKNGLAVWKTKWWKALKGNSRRNRIERDKKSSSGTISNIQTFSIWEFQKEKSERKEQKSLKK